MILTFSATKYTDYKSTLTYAWVLATFYSTYKWTCVLICRRFSTGLFILVGLRSLTAGASAHCAKQISLESGQHVGPHFSLYLWRPFGFSGVLQVCVCGTESLLKQDIVADCAVSWLFKVCHVMEREKVAWPVLTRGHVDKRTFSMLNILCFLCCSSAGWVANTFKHIGAFIFSSNNHLCNIVALSISKCHKSGISILNKTGYRV